MTELEKTPLFHLNPGLHVEDPMALAHIAYRYSRPWEETVSLTSAKEIICDIFDLPAHHPVVGLLLENAETTYSMKDFFSGGNAKVTVARVITISNGKALAAAIQEMPKEGRSVFMPELVHFGSGEPHMFVADGLFLVSDNYMSKNQLLWDGNHFRSIKHKEHDFFVERVSFEIDNEVIEAGGHHYDSFVTHVVDLIEKLHKGRFHGQELHIKAVGKPFYLIQNVYAFSDDVLSASVVAFSKSLNLANEPPNGEDV